MICPRCGTGLADSATSCVVCGVVFAKLARREAAERRKRQALRDEIDALPMPDTTNVRWWYYRIAVLFLLAWISWDLIPEPISANAAGQSFLHAINLPFHEAGHVIFRPFGALIASLGGSLGQMLVPLVCMFVLWFKTRDAFGAGVCGWWFGENLLEIAPYIDDARRLSLSLLGGNYGDTAPYGFHDWEFILKETGLLQFDHAIATTAQVIGVVIMLAAMVWCVFWLLEQRRLLKAIKSPA